MLCRSAAGSVLGRSMLEIPDTKGCRHALICVSKIGLFGQKEVTFGDVADMSPTCCRHVTGIPSLAIVV